MFVEIKSKLGQIGCGRGNMERKTVMVHTVWVTTDDGNTSGYSCSNKPGLAARLKACIEDGKAYDAEGNFNILMRCANADLNRLGY